MKGKTAEKHQQWQLFIKELVTFALLFAALGLVVYFLFYQSIYHEMNHGLQWQKNQIMQNSPVPRVNHLMGSEAQKAQKAKNQVPPKDGSFRANLVVFNKNGRVINDPMLGERDYDLLKNTQLIKRHLNRISNLSLTADGITGHFKTLLIKVPKSNPNPVYAGRYVLIMKNIDADLQALTNFRTALVTTLIIFWILAIAIAYFLSRSSMKPIILAWRKQRDFSGNAAHELRTPLTVIQNQLEYLLTKPKSRIMDEAEEVSTALDEVRHMQTLTNQLLMLARSDSNVIQLNQTDVDLQPWLEKSVKLYSDIATSQQKELKANIKVSGHGSFDPDLIRQVLTILLDNAIKYTPTNGTVTVNAKRIHDPLQHEALHLQVADTGPGIADSEKTKIFERFYRTDKSRNSKTGGNGLGLAIAKWIVTRHHGKINVKDNEPCGSVFNVTIPLKSAKTSV
ncbi:two-component system sensor histidine kinase [Secundilactobacillus silagincola]|uniref:histidine kinase n=1 Tax=Secundilactobacillus silagincola TaxID=1714681 RepID=A0A1Z5H5B5_9LACO|nr:HAMP domain-containing sensor histidine kinase [Secundilactobacillus silagincola]GAT18104.1 two-component system sensor histidine kinase [Secundilactobacillus silagincola]